MGETRKEEGCKRFEIVKAIELIEKLEKEPKPVALWDKISEGTIGLFAGAAKTGKTTFAENLAISISVGRKEFFGKLLSGIPRKVLFINLEESYRIRGWRNIKQLTSLTKEELNLFRDNYISTPIDFPEFINDDNDWEILSRYIYESNADVVFIDSLTNMFNGKIEDSDTCRKFIQKMQHYVVSLGKTVIIIHHTTKGNEKPIEQDNSAGSRVIIQYFQFIYGFANIPTEIGGKYMCSLTNKIFGIDSNEANLYNISDNNWFMKSGIDNKYNLYKQTKNYSVDGRNDTTNKDLVYNYIVGLDSQSSTSISSKQLMDAFVVNDTMAKDTLYKNIDKLIDDKKIVKIKKGEYTLYNENGNEARA